MGLRFCVLQCVLPRNPRCHRLAAARAPLSVTAAGYKFCATVAADQHASGRWLSLQPPKHDQTLARYASKYRSDNTSPRGREPLPSGGVLAALLIRGQPATQAIDNIAVGRRVWPPVTGAPICERRRSSACGTNRWKTAAATRQATLGVWSVHEARVPSTSVGNRPVAFFE